MKNSFVKAPMAFGDESIRMLGDPPFYMLGVCVLKNADAIDLDALAKIMPPGSKKLHWRDMGQDGQRQSLCILEGIESVDLVAIAAPLDGKKQERARRKCLEAILPALEAQGIEQLVLESRGETTDRLDIDFIKYAKGSKLVETIRLTHADGRQEPRLWIADQIIGAMGDYLTQAGNWSHWQREWESLSQRVERIEVSL